MVEFESALECDLAIVLEFDDDVLAYDEQPVRLEYLDRDDRPRTGVPDFLLRYRSDRKPLLGDVKCRCDLFLLWPQIKPRPMDARVYETSITPSSERCSILNRIAAAQRRAAWREEGEGD
jgi:hypothetical protein